MYTSGCPKNQNKCWYSTGSPPPLGSKKEVLRLRSVRSIVIAPARTGRDNSSKIAVSITDHGNRDVFSDLWNLIRIFRMVAMKFAAPRIELTPAKWREKMVKSTAGPEWAKLEESGG